MPIAQILQSLKGACRFCRQQAGLLQRDHPECIRTHQAGWQEMVQLAAQAASAHTFNEAALRQTLQAIANRSRATGEDIDSALEEGFAQGVAQAMSDGISPVTRRSASEPSGTVSPWRTAPRTRARWPNWTVPGRTGL